MSQLVRVRDAAIHLTAESKTLPYLVFSLGTAALRNYAKLVNSCFSLSLSDYNFYILPLGFSYPFKTMSLTEFRREPDIIASIIKDVENVRISVAENDEYFFVCEIQTSLVSAKKITEDTDITAKIDQQNGSAIIVNRKVNLLDQYPFTWNQVYESLKRNFPTLKNHQLNDFIRQEGIKGNPKYSAYNFRSKTEEAKGPTKNTAVIYNSEFMQYVDSYFAATVKA